jgi:predicted ATP-grasp superfamily ATP-dependent carboligase
VLLGGAVTALSAARSLGAAGIEVTILSDGATDCLARRSRFCDHYVHYERTEPVQARWLEWLSGRRGAVLLPCCDGGAEFIARRRAELVGAGHLPIEADEEALLLMLDKPHTYALAEQLGIGAPRTVTAYSHEDATRALQTALTYPCAVKPTSSDALLRRAPDFDKPKGNVVHNDTQLHAYLDGLLSVGVGALVTEVIPGGDDRYCSYYTYIDEHGEPLVQFTKLKPRQYPIGFGLGTFHVTKWLPDVADVGLRFFQGIGLRGFGNIEFKRDERDNELKVIECNPRLTMANGLAARAGVDFALLAYDRAVGHERPPIVTFRDNVCLWFPREDLRALGAYRAQGELTTGAWLRSIAQVPHFPTFQWSDPVPSLAGARGALRQWWRRSRGPRGDGEEVARLDPLPGDLNREE